MARWCFKMILKCNKILEIHAKWLFANDYVDKSINCMKQSKNDVRYKKGKTRLVRNKKGQFIKICSGINYINTLKVKGNYLKEIGIMMLMTKNYQVLQQYYKRLKMLKKLKASRG